MKWISKRKLRVLTKSKSTKEHAKSRGRRRKNDVVELTVYSAHHHHPSEWLFCRASPAKAGGIVINRAWAGIWFDQILALNLPDSATARNGEKIIGHFLVKLRVSPAPKNNAPQPQEQNENRDKVSRINQGPLIHPFPKDENGDLCKSNRVAITKFNQSEVREVSTRAGRAWK